MFDRTDYKELYNNILADVYSWFVQENKIRPVQGQMDDNGVQHNALMNFIVFNLHTLVTTQGFVHMQELLQAHGTDQTVMIRLKDLVVILYVKYGKKNIDNIRKRIYQSTDMMYGLSFKSEDMDINNTFWLYPFFRHVYNTVAAQ